MTVCPLKEWIILSSYVWHCFYKEDQWLLPSHPRSKLAAARFACSHLVLIALGNPIWVQWGIFTPVLRGQQSVPHTSCCLLAPASSSMTVSQALSPPCWKAEGLV